LQFINGDYSKPAITGFVGADGDNYVPESLRFGDNAKPIARLGDTVDIFFPAALPFAGFINGTTPITGTITMTLTNIVGIISTASKLASVE
jgi:hypothetical protein